MINNLKVLALLILIGLIVHYPIFSFGLYGDDWQSIYCYLAKDNKTETNLMGGFYGPLPGNLTFISQYGPSCMSIGFLYSLFGQIDPIYYLISFTFKILAAFSLYLLCKELFQKNENSSVIITFLTSVLYVVGVTGSQTTDYAVQLQIYLAIAFYFLALKYHLRSFRQKDYSYLFITLLFSVLSLTISPIRIFPILLLIPLLDITKLFFEKKDKKFLQFFFVKIGLWLGVIFLAFLVGIFSAPFKISSSYSDSAKSTLQMIYQNPAEILNHQLIWLGSVIVPDQFAKNKILLEFIGIIFIISLIFILLKIGSNLKENLFFPIVCFFVFFVTMGIYTPLRGIGSEDRYLVLIFANFCFLYFSVNNSLITRWPKIKSLLISLLLILILMHIIVTVNNYKIWLSNGRSAKFLNNVTGQITKKFTHNLTNKPIVYLDFDNAPTLTYVQYGLDYKILVKSKTYTDKYFPLVMNSRDNKGQLIPYLQTRIKSGHSRKDLLDNMYVFQYKNGDFVELTMSAREDIDKILQPEDKGIDISAGF